jgi:hypothetical protein
MMVEDVLHDAFQVCRHVDFKLEHRLEQIPDLLYLGVVGYE